MTATAPIRRRDSQPQALLPRRSRGRTPPWRRAERRAILIAPARPFARLLARVPARGRGAARPARPWPDATPRRMAVPAARPGTAAQRGMAAPGAGRGMAAAAARRRPVARGGMAPAGPQRGMVAPAARRRLAAPGAQRGMVLPAAWRRLAAPAARRELEAAVPEVIDVLRATVAAGINPRRALQAAAEGAPPALEPVLRQAIQAAELGSGAGQALAMAAGAERLTELALAGEALDLAESTGAPPGPVLAGVAVAAADRVRTRQARMAATAQARLSARVVAAMAPAFLGVLALTAPGEAAFLIREPLGWATLAAALTLELLGVAWSAHIVRGAVT
jgi:Type II secretion system (T2SS), protein F